MAAGAGLDLTTDDEMAQAERGCFPKVQILTIEELLAGARPEYPRYAPEATFQRAPRRRSQARQGRLA